MKDEKPKQILLDLYSLTDDELVWLHKRMDKAYRKWYSRKYRLWHWAMWGFIAAMFAFYIWFAIINPGGAFHKLIW